jgi:hypothetical protein
MNDEHLWPVTKQLINPYGGTTTATPSNLPPHEAQHTENATNSEDSVQRSRSDSAISGASVPDVVYNSTLPTSNGLTFGEELDLSAQEYYSDSDVSVVSLVPDMDNS